MLKTVFFSEVCCVCYLNCKAFQNSFYNHVFHECLDVWGRDVGARARFLEVAFPAFIVFALWLDGWFYP